MQVRETQPERFQYVNDQGKGQLDWGDFKFIVVHRLQNRDTPQDLLQAFKVGDVATFRTCWCGNFNLVFFICLTRSLTPETQGECPL